jgi:GTP-binding protein HflX
MELYNTNCESDYAILVGVGVNEILTEADLDELANLCETCNIKTAGRVIQNRHDIDVTYYIGSGKVAEIKTLIAETNATAVVFDVELSGSKVRNLETEWNVTVLDRSKIILDIFAGRAKSSEGKLQVELAQLKYNMPRLIGSGGKMGKMKNAVGMRGPGEKKLELDKRRIRDQILKLEKELANVSKNRQIARKSDGRKPRVCIVGYTNSGKSTLLNTITKADVYANDELFATLDPTTRSVYLTPEHSILLTDTVGFINKLPHEFINAFESTLIETKEADLLLHICDISNPEWQKQVLVVNSVLHKIGADAIPQILAANKCDKIKERLYEDMIYISAQKNIGIDKLKEKIISSLPKYRI